MKSKVNRSLTEWLFPKLMVSVIYPELVVLFTDDNCGVVVNPHNISLNFLGLYKTNWDMKLFIEFRGTVELSN